MPIAVDHLGDNHLLNHLPAREQDVLRPHLLLVSMKTKGEVTPLGSPVRHIHFPVTASLSLMDLQASGRSVEVAVVGKEGGTCFSVLDGLMQSPCRVIVQIGGMAFSLDVSTLPTLLPHLPVFARAARRFSQVLLRHAVISVGCSQFHTVEQRLARWLLAHWNRTGLTQFPFTHDFLAEQLGVQRATVTEALGAFQRRGLVTYGYGKVALLEMSGVGQAACECSSSASQAIDQYLMDIKQYT
jgi:hypothetical protein